MHSILQKQRSNWIFLAMERGDSCHYGEIRKVGEGSRISCIDHLRRKELAIRELAIFPDTQIGHDPGSDERTQVRLYHQYR